MSKVVTFSRTFPSYHPRKGEPTYFVEKIWKFLWDNEQSNHNPINGYFQYYDEAFPSKYLDVNENIHSHTPKGHTIRGGHRFKVGDKFSPRVWSGKPYASKQIIIAPDIEVKKVWDFKMEGYHIWINKELYCQYRLSDKIVALASNDGLSLKDFWDWFPYKKGKVFDGQIICWNESINY